MRFCTWPPGPLASSQGRPLAAKQRSKGGAISCAQGRRRRGIHRGKERGEHELPLEGLGARGCGPWWARREEGRPAANWTGGGDVPEGKGMGEAEVEQTGGAVRKRRVAGKRHTAISSAQSAGTGEERGKKREKRID